MRIKKYQNSLRKARQQRGLKQVQLAAASGIGVATVNRLENYPMRASARTAAALANVLGVSVVAIFPYLNKRGRCQRSNSYEA
jgi:transcriptional regulator with XRE-family HTH domain